MSLVFLTGIENYRFRRFMNGCEGKSAHRSLSRAIAARDYVLARNPEAHVAGTGAYKCEFCGKWHLGHGASR